MHTTAKKSRKSNLFNDEDDFNLLDGDASDLLRDMKANENGSFYTPTPLKEIKYRRDSGEIQNFKSQSSGEDPADMMRVLGNEDALFMTMSENGMQDSIIIDSVQDNQMQTNINNTMEDFTED